MAGIRSMVTLGLIVDSGTYTENIELSGNLSGYRDSNVSLYSGFLIDPTSIVLSGHGVSIPTFTTAEITVTFGGENGDYARQIFNKYSNFSFEYSAIGEVEILENSISATTVSWTISNTAVEKVDFIIQSSANFDTFNG